MPRYDKCLNNGCEYGENGLKNVESDNNKILYEILLEFFLQRNGIFFLNKPRIYVRATCFDLVGHLQALQENRSKSCLVFPALWVLKCLHVSVTGAKKYISLYKLNLLYDGFN